MKSIFFYILIRSWNSFKYFDKCINSVFSQNYKNYQILYVDDYSDYTNDQINYIKKKLKEHIAIFNTFRKYSVRNAYEVIHCYTANNDSVIINLDADDCFLGRNTLETIAKAYCTHDLFLTYGNCIIWDGYSYYPTPSKDLFPYGNKPYPKHVVRNNLYRKEPFRALHPRTWKTKYFKKISLDNFLQDDNKWLRFAEDQAIFYPLLEMARGKYEVIKKPIYVYNIANPLGDKKVNAFELLKDELIIRKKTIYESVE